VGYWRHGLVVVCR